MHHRLYRLSHGIMTAHVPHAVYGQTRFKMLLTVIV